MTFLAIDQSHVHTDDGLYSGEEICTMLGDNDCFSVGIEQVGLEISLDPEILSNMTILSSSSSQGNDQASINRCISSYTADETVPTSLRSVERMQSAAIHAAGTANNVGRAASKSLTKKSIKGRLIVFKRQFLTKASSKLWSIVRGTNSFPPSPYDSLLSSKSLKMSSDNSTCAISLKSSTSFLECMPMPSSITTSTCDFPSEPNHEAVLESYLTSNPWDAAKRGDYATLQYIANNDDINIWTQEDVHGHVPLYYACTSYSQSNGQGSFGKYGLESIKLLVDLWPSNREFPRALLKECKISSGRSSERNSRSLHKDVLKVLAKSDKGRPLSCPPLLLSIRTSSSLQPPEMKKTNHDLKIDGVSDVVPVSFLEDLGDDGYVEDYWTDNRRERQNVIIRCREKELKL